jgi:long-chain acyl-CoA synthetase
VSTTGFATPFIYSSYSECLARVNAVAAGLDGLGLLCPNDDDGGRLGLKVIGLYSKNCVEWVIAEHAAYSVGAVTAPLYDTLGPDAVRYVLSQTGAKSVLATRDGLDVLSQAKRSGKCPAFTHVILIDGVSAGGGASEMARASGLELVSFARVEAVGAEALVASGGRHRHSPPSPDDVATLCYTSGTTGNPKGALITHQNLISTISGIIRSISDFEPHVYDRHLSYLPLAHIMERVA